MDNLIDNTAVKQFSHYLQLIRNKRFRMFDYGYEKNKALYRRSIPLEYNLKKVTIPITIMRPIYDVLSTREVWIFIFVYYGFMYLWIFFKDLRLLMKKLSNVRDMIELPGNHIDYFFDPPTLDKLKRHIVRSLV